ncbi:MAG: Aromatic amino acid exporter YddG [Candidatus Erwinia impunctatus]|nr:Aromatic amino acid exporter YddG [Culicoides impunctatus]
MITPSHKATVAGLTAIVLWSMSIGLIRTISEHFGPTLGAALIYTGSAVLLCITGGVRAGRTLPLPYLIAGGFLFVSYEIALAIAIGLARTREQAVELGMINYLWPCLTVILAIPFNRQRFTFWLWLGLVLCTLGLLLVMNDNLQWSPKALWQNITENPAAYSLAFFAAFAWALYNNVTRRWAKGTSGVSLFFVITALILWVKFFFEDTAFNINFSGSALVTVTVMACSTAFAYSGWNRGMQYGSLPLLTSVSYFTPVLSALLAAQLLGLNPSLMFWIGVVILSMGSLLCWRSLH